MCNVYDKIQILTLVGIKIELFSIKTKFLPTNKKIKYVKWTKITMTKNNSRHFIE